MCGIQPKHISIYVKRKVINVLRNGMVDDKDEKNVAFRAKMLAKKGVTIAAGFPETADIPAKAGKVKKEPAAATPPPEPDPNSLNYIQRERNKLEVIKTQHAIQLQQIEIAKKRGELVPTQSVNNLIVQHSESIKTAYTEGTDNLLIIFAQKFQLSSADVGFMRGQIMEIVNKAVDESIDRTKKNLKGVVKEYAVKRGVGQHD